MLPLLQEIRGAVKTHMAALPVPYRTHEGEPSFQSLRDTHWHGDWGSRPFPIALDPFTCNRFEIADFGRAGAGARHPLPRRLLRRGAASHPRAGRSRRQASAGEQVLRRHVEARVPGLARADQAGAEGLRGQALSARPALNPRAAESSGRSCSSRRRVGDVDLPTRRQARRRDRAFRRRSHIVISGEPLPEQRSRRIRRRTRAAPSPTTGTT